ncbi:MAG: redox-regulated ATPase YchF [Phycisphaerales bacterium]|nr:redox-regulated ATPase YchF [Phycisphaerales bacterium]
MKAAIIGLPFSGKSTLFAATTSHRPDPGEMTQEHLAVVHVPDARLDFLTKLYNPKKVTLATIEFVDIPGFSLADAQGRQQLRKHLPTIRNSDVLVLVVRDFENPSVPAYRNRVDRAGDLSELRDEIIFADLEVVTNRVEKLEKAVHKPSKTHDQDKRELAIMQACQVALEAGKPLSTCVHNEEDARVLASFGFLTEKPAIVVYNVDEDRAGGEPVEAPEHFHSAVALCADLEAQINDLEPADRAAFLEDMNITTPARDVLIQRCFDAMNYISFLTMGPDEVRAWPIQRGIPAVEAAGKIHSDLARGFIRAETVAYDDLVATGDLKGAKAAGKVRQEGKTYIVQDGDILNIKFNV